MSTIPYIPGVPVAHEEETYLNVSYRVKSWLLTRDHKRIALLYLISLTAFFFVGGAAATLMRLELMTPKPDLVSIVGVLRQHRIDRNDLVEVLESLLAVRRLYLAPPDIDVVVRNVGSCEIGRVHSSLCVVFNAEVCRSFARSLPPHGLRPRAWRSCRPVARASSSALPHAVAAEARLVLLR